ncbi:MAG: hypothetical protein AABW81_03145 [Nanoarchaeota archaeon]
MPSQDTSQIKENMVSSIRKRGPCLPVNIAGDVGMSILFTSAFLSELVSDKIIKMSYMRVGSSPVYFLSGQEDMLEKFAMHLKSKEKEAYLLLKEKKFLKDTEQEPAIRVAIRFIKDFAIPMKREDVLFWRYFTIPESELEEEKQIKEIEQIITLPVKQEGKVLEISDKTPEKKPEKKEKKKKQVKAKAPEKKQNDRFFNKVKESLLRESIEILDIENFSKNEIILRVRVSEEEKIVIAYNKKKITEQDITKSYKKISDSNLKYIILSFGEPAKKTDNLIEAVKKLDKIIKIGE